MKTPRLLLLLAISLFPILARAGEEKAEAVDTEHIFGFAEGSDIGGKGERELELTSTGAFGKPGAFAAIENEADVRYGVTDRFRASLGLLGDYHGIYASPGLDDRAAAAFSGVTSEFRYALMERDAAPFGLTLSFAPEWRRRDATSGAPLENFSLPVAALADKALIPDKLFIVANLTYTPNFSRAEGVWAVGHPLEVAAAAAYAIAPGVFVSAEARHLVQNQSGFFTGHALFAGPGVYFKIGENASFKIAWSAQLPDETSHRLDLVNYERHQVRAVFATNF